MPSPFFATGSACAHSGSPCTPGPGSVCLSCVSGGTHSCWRSQHKAWASQRSCQNQGRGAKGLFSTGGSWGSLCAPWGMAEHSWWCCVKGERPDTLQEVRTEASGSLSGSRARRLCAEHRWAPQGNAHSPGLELIWIRGQAVQGMKCCNTRNCKRDLGSPQSLILRSRYEFLIIMSLFSPCPAPHLPTPGSLY